jgi:Ca-activated chloride channel family protein
MKHLKLLLLAIILFTSVSINTLAQDEDISVETNLVTLNVAVTDKNGNYIKNLKKEDFEVYDSNLKQEIEEFSSEDAPVYFGIIYDLHPTTDERTINVLEALRAFTRELKQKDDYFLTVFNERGGLTTDFVPSCEQIDNALSDKKPNSLYDAIIAASEKVRERKNVKHVLLVLTDGEDNASHHSLKELRLRLRSVNLPVYTVNFNDDKQSSWNYTDIYRNGQRRTLDFTETSELNKAALDEISKTSGGQTFEKQIINRVFLKAIFQKVLREVENQYVIGFYPEKTDGKWHKLKVGVKTEKGKLKLSNRKGYQSKKG